MQAGVDFRRLDTLVAQRFGDLLDREAQVEHAHSAGMARHVAGEVFGDAQWLGDLFRQRSVSFFLRLIFRPSKGLVESSPSLRARRQIIYLAPFNIICFLFAQAFLAAGTNSTL